MASVGMMGYVGMGVSDLKKWEEFATNILGLEVSERGQDGTLFLRMDDYHYRIIVQPDGRDDMAFIGWEVANEDELNALYDQIKAAGVEVRRATKEECEERMVTGMIKFDDPNGIQEEAFYGPLIDYLMPFRSPRGVEFETGRNMGMGHVTMAADNLQESVKFYKDVLGMKLSDWIQPQPERGAASTLNIAFFHANPRHHSLAFWEGNIGKRMHHFMLQTKDVNDVGRAFDNCMDSGTPIIMSMGRHTNDHMLSFYMGTPSGTAVEYGWGAREVGPDWTMQFHKTGSIWGHRAHVPQVAEPA